MRHRDPERVRRHERLRVLDPAGADRRIADVAERQLALNAGHRLGGEDVADEPRPLAQMEAAVVRDDPGGVLSAVLNGQKAVVDLAHRRVGADQPDEAAHDGAPFRENDARADRRGRRASPRFHFGAEAAPRQPGAA